MSSSGHLRIEHDFGGGFVRLRTSEAERRQAAQDIRCSEDIVIELLRNARDAHASNIYVALAREGSVRSITVIDDGQGIPSSMHEHVFEPRVTSKLDSSHMDKWGLHGRGMALYSVAQNASSSYVAASDTSLGTSIVVKTNLDKIGERSDQSTFPTFELSEGSKVKVRGPRNMLRCTCEFALEERKSCSVFIGAVSEIAATLYAYGKATLSAIERAFCNDVDSLPISKRLATTADPASFAALSSSLGLPISERTARRILDGEIDQLDPILNSISIDRPKASKTQTIASGRKRSRDKVKISSDDARAFSESVKEAYSSLAEKYYLDDNVDPLLRVGHDKLTLTIPVVKADI